ncbi:hypothetical protein [Mycobacterium haemophilum]|uniref:Transmembrane protein n=1 Tax=Mycobacterium haemophilum TaxID=29311 RepID=A0A0I9U1G6_9MYCO|nr:hypothetical protein [Mycobacterium haemophilum]AKN15879.1 hypothetical protein B586_03785 [Mycobacterium haemophilum DSM 44634]KLO27022.1 hypothetical protein ABH39_16625 [Mycobacterium haemophilum]KLO34953.1 hypothetical protein ABH38_17350 [Mycobacterium haemophilum]KLO40930.1 hypothetical protein ABH37_14925 [Mycobacterium haemophilum]KLO47254.1 hypothetical protein ABH36_17280 [Mycobacterium haemophilum]
MNGKNGNLTIDRGADIASESAQGNRRRNIRLWVNWGLALTTVPVAATVMLFALGAVLSTDDCVDRQCPNLGLAGIDFGVLFYGAPLVAVLVIGISFFSATRPAGIAVPLCGWALLVADVAILAATATH